MGTRYSRLVFTAVPGDEPEAASAIINRRCAGTNVGLSMRTVFEPVPDCPATCQLSSMLQSVRGTSTNPGAGGDALSAAGNCAPRMTHSELSTFDTNCQRP